MMSLRVVLIGAACLIASFAPSMAETMTFKTQLSPTAEVPPNHSNGKGDATVTYDTVSKKLSWKVGYSGLTGPATMAHFHGPAGPGKNAPVVVPIFTSAAAAKSPAEGSATLNDDQAKQLGAGEWYVNVHTEANKGGEIRGQLAR
jgi:CHRD domain-containing protein